MKYIRTTYKPEEMKAVLGLLEAIEMAYNNDSFGDRNLNNVIVTELFKKGYRIVKVGEQ